MTATAPGEAGAPPDVIVRRASADDAWALARLKIEWARLDEPPTDAAAAAFADDLEAWMLAQGDALVAAIALAGDAVVGDAVVGMAWMVVFERVPDVHDRQRRTADIQSVYVRSHWRGAGVGARLVGILCDEADSRGIPHITVAANDAARMLYTRAGFTSTAMMRVRPAPH